MYGAISPINPLCAQSLTSIGFLDVAAQEVRAAFEVLGNARRLAAIFEAFIGALGDDHFNVRREPIRAVAEDMRTQQHLITSDVDHHMSRYEVCGPRGIELM